MAHVPLAFALACALALGAGCIGPQDAPSTSTATTAPTVSTPADCQAVAPSGASNAPGAQVSNQPGAFSYSAQKVAAADKEEFKWTNPSSAARVSFNGGGAVGSVKLTLLDACGKQAYSKTLSAQSTGESERGTPGAWLVRLEWSTYTGAAQFSITSG